LQELLLTKLAAAACREDAEATTFVDTAAVESVVAVELAVEAAASGAPITIELVARRRTAILERTDTMVTRPRETKNQKF